MKHLFKALFFTPLGIILGLALSTAGIVSAVSAYPVATGGTGTTSVPVNQILTGNGTSAFNSNTATGTSPYGINVLSGCVAVNGICLGGTGTMTGIGLGFGGTSTVYAILATTTSTTNGRTDALTIVNSGSTYTFTPSQSGTLTVAGGGTGAATLTGCLTGNGTGAITGSGTCNTSAASVTSVGLSSTNSTLSIGSTPVTTSGTITADLNLAHSNVWTVLQSFSNASTSQLSVTGKSYFGGTATTTIDSTGAITVATTNVNTIPNATTTNVSVSQSLNIPSSSSQSPTSAGQAALDTTDNQFKIGDGSATAVYSSLGAFAVPYGATTTWTGSTSAQYIGNAPFGMTIKSAQCHTDTGTVNAQLQYAATLVPMVMASSTDGVQPISSNNTPAKGDLLQIVYGTPASTPTFATCTFSFTVIGS